MKRARNEDRLGELTYSRNMSSFALRVHYGSWGSSHRRLSLGCSGVVSGQNTPPNPSHPPHKLIISLGQSVQQRGEWRNGDAKRAGSATTTANSSGSYTFTECQTEPIQLLPASQVTPLTPAV